MSEKTPEFFMRRAIKLAQRGFPAPNPRVGCVVVREGEIVGEGYHAYAGGPHAEVVALDQAGANAAGSTVYVTLEPCNHHGRTPPCTNILLAEGVKKVVYSVPDPNLAASGGGRMLRRAGVSVESGLLAAEAERGNQAFLTAMRLSRPFVVLKAAIALDGRIALPNGESKWITGSKARTAGHRLRAEMGAVLVGAGTIRMDRPALTARIRGVKNQPIRVELGGSKDIVNGTTFVTPYSTTVVYPHHVEVRQLLSELFERGITGLLVEGGAQIYGLFLKSGFVDRIELFMSPKVLGQGLSWLNTEFSDQVSDCPRFEIEAIRRFGDDLNLKLLPLPQNP